MANTYITSSTSFRPYTFDEMIKPYQMYTDAYNKTDEQLNALLENSATNFSFMPQDVKEKAVYDDIMRKLNNLSDQLAEGLNPNVIRNIQNINKEYRIQMLPIQKKIAKREELTKQQYTMQASNPNIRFTKDYSKVGLEDITDNSSFNVINLDTIYKQTGTDFAKITSQIYNDDLDPVAIGDTGYYKVKSGYGYTPDAFITQFNTEGSDVNKFYKERVSAIKSRTDIDDDVKKEMIDAVYRGMEATAGTFSEKIVKGSSDSTPDNQKGWVKRTTGGENDKYDYWSIGNSSVLHAVLKGKHPEDTGAYVGKKEDITPPKPKDKPKVSLKPNQTISGQSLFNYINKDNTYTNFANFKKKMKEKFGNSPVSNFKINGHDASGVIIKYSDFNVTDPMAMWMLQFAGEDAINDYIFYYDLNTGNIHTIQGKSVTPITNSDEGIINPDVDGEDFENVV